MTSNLNFLSYIFLPVEGIIAHTPGGQENGPLAYPITSVFYLLPPFRRGGRSDTLRRRKEILFKFFLSSFSIVRNDRINNIFFRCQIKIMIFKF